MDCICYGSSWLSDCYDFVGIVDYAICTSCRSSYDNGLVDPPIPAISESSLRGLPLVTGFQKRVQMKVIFSWINVLSRQKRLQDFR
jgi:hypothetical protein